VVAQIDGDLGLLLHLVFVGWSVAAVLLGDALRTRGERMRRLEERARELERTQEEESRRRVAEDRLAIARDLHDSVAHAMATINVQAGAAAHVVERRPEAAKEALAAIQSVSRDVLDELAALLGLLRDTGDPADRTPTPGLDRIPEVVESARAAGVEIQLVLDGPTTHVSPPVATAAYRVVQESLTNVIRHARGAPTTVFVHTAADGALTVEVRDAGSATGVPTAAPTTGMGIRGMRERAAATGGTVVAEAGSDGGFRVCATWAGSS
jgi:signal transduction histidine kinase